jgi:hypothetical protein
LATKNDTIADALLRREVFLQRFASHLVNTNIDGTIQSFSKKLPSLLDEFGDAENLTLSERRAVSRLVTIQMRDDWRGMWIETTNSLDEMAMMDANYLGSIYEDIDDINLSIPNQAVLTGHINQSIMILTSGTTAQAGVWTKYLKDNTDAAAKAINGAIWDGYTSGLTNQQISKQIRGTYNRNTKMYQGGILQGRVRAQADALVRTGTNHFSNQARDRTYQANADVLQDRILIATLDSRTTLLCRGRHLKSWDINDLNYPRLPFHFNERSVYVVKAKGIDALDGSIPSKGGKLVDGKLVNSIKPIDADTTMDTWLRGQPKQFVVDSIGKSRAELFLKGKLPIEKFTDLTGRTLTLDQLKSVEANEKAFRLSGL